jgi:hypothetical protein
MKRSGGAAVAGPVRFKAGLPSVPGHCVSITHVPFSRSPHGGVSEYRLSDRQSTDASDRAVDSRGVLVHTNNRLQHFWRRTCRVGIKTTDAPKQVLGCAKPSFHQPFGASPTHLARDFVNNPGLVLDCSGDPTNLAAPQCVARLRVRLDLHRVAPFSRLLLLRQSVGSSSGLFAKSLKLAAPQCVARLRVRLDLHRIALFLRLLLLRQSVGSSGSLLRTLE